MQYRITLTPSETDYVLKRLQQHADIINQTIEHEYDRYSEKELEHLVEELHKIYPILSAIVNAERID